MRVRPFIPIIILSFSILIGCTGSRTTVERAAPRLLYKSFVAHEKESQSATRTSKIKQPEILQLKDALALALHYNPQLAVFSLEIRAREAWALQQSFLPNPELNVEVENFGGSSNYGAFRSTETTLSLGQLIELGGKRQKRTRIAALESDMAAWDYEAVRLDVFTEVVKSFTEVLAAQERVRMDEELLALAEKFVATITKRVEAGKISTAEAARAKVELSVAGIELERARRELTAARQRLAAAWGGIKAEFLQAEGKLDIALSFPALEKLQALINDNPDLARWVVEMERRQAVRELEKANVIPDPIVSGAYRRLNESGDNAFVIGLSIPLQLFNRNQGAVQEAEYRVKQSEKQRQVVETQVKSRLAIYYQLLSALHNEASTLKDKIIPDARTAYEVINRGYLLGKFTSLDVLDAQRTLFETRGRYLRTITDLHHTTADIERLVGRSLADVK